MRAIIHVNGMTHQQQHGHAMFAGLKRHGLDVRFGAGPESCDFAVVWGWKRHDVIDSAPHVLVMERGHVGNRMQLASCGWDGLGYRGRYPTAPDGERWDRMFGHLLEPWTNRTGYALIIGQVDSDAALRGLDLHEWVQQQVRELHARGWQTRFRPHPLVTRTRRSLAQDLAGAALCVTYNSTSGVESVLAGVPTVTLDEGAMAWPVSGHTLDEVVRPDRETWAHDLAWTNWTMDEIASGEAWEHLEGVLCTTA